MNPPVRAGLLSLILLCLCFVGLVLVPNEISNRAIIAPQGTQISIRNNLSFIPFVVSDNSTIRGSLVSNQDIQVFIVNSTTSSLSPFDPPSGYVFSSGLSSSFSLNISLPRGSYYLIFFGTNPGYSSAGATILVTTTIKMFRAGG